MAAKEDYDEADMVDAPLQFICPLCLSDLSERLPLLAEVADCLPLQLLPRLPDQQSLRPTALHRLASMASRELQADRS